MSDAETNMPEHELQAYVDGELPPQRIAAVEAWLAGHPEDARRVAEWREQAEAIRAHYAALEPVPARFDLADILRGSRVWRSVAAVGVTIAFLAGGIVGWMAHGASAAAPSRF